MDKYVLRDSKSLESYSLADGWTLDTPTFFNQISEIKALAHNNRFTLSWQKRVLVVDTYDVVATVKLEDISNG